jgi:peptide subunit release factor 1 (eRF1)
MSELAPILQRLSRIRSEQDFVVSCYLRLDLRDRVREKYLVALKDAMKPLRSAADRLEHRQREAVERDLKRIQEYAERRVNLPGTPGLAIFACGPLKLFEAIPLPRVHRTRVALDHTPMLRELTAAEEDFGRVLASVVDRQHARIFEVTAFGCAELPCLIGMTTRGGKFHSDRADSPGWGEAAFHHRIREERSRHYAQVAHELATLDHRLPVRGVVLAGSSPERVLPFLPKSLASRVIGTARLNPTAISASDVRAKVLDLRRTHELASERALVAELEEALGTGWAVSGARPTLRALSRGQLRTLLIRPDLTGWGFRCADTGRLALAKGDCRGEGTPLPVADVVNEAIEEGLHQKVTITVIDDPASGEAIDGLAGQLRFRG